MNLIRVPTGVAVDRPGSAPLPLFTIVGIGRNYAEHAKEMTRAEAGKPAAAAAPVPATAPDPAKSYPTVFTKNPAAACLSGDPIIIPRICQDPTTGGDQVDFEGELAVIIGEPTRDVAKADALSRVLGYACANDVSARWWQKSGSGGQFFRGKSFDTFCPIGPKVIPAAEVADPNGLRLTTRINGAVMQDAGTAEMLFDVATLISELSRGMTLLPGTVILTGTPAGVGMARTPPVYLKHGDTVEITIEKIGTLSNPVRFEGR